MNPFPLVNLLQGTRSIHDFSTGNTLPLVARPWGMHHWTLQTATGPSFYFHPDHPKLQGVRLTHQPSPWMGDYGNLVVSAFHGPLHIKPEFQASAYRIDRTLLQPNRLKTTQLRYRMTLEMSPTERGALFVFTRTEPLPIRVRLNFDGSHSVSKTEDRTVFTGTSRNHNGGVSWDFGLRFAAAFDTPPVSFEAFRCGVVFTFPPDIDRVELRLAGSFISEEQARVTLKAELAGRDLDEIAGEGEKVWTALLERIRLPEPQTEQEQSRARTFYSCLYRCLLFPRFLDEIDENGRTIHCSHADGNIYPGSLCADGSEAAATFTRKYVLQGRFHERKRSMGFQPMISAGAPRSNGAYTPLLSILISRESGLEAHASVIC